MLTAAATAAFFALLTFACARVRVGSAVHRAVCRGVNAVWTILLFSLLPYASVGLNLLTVACVSCLGLPGLGLMQVICLMA